MGRKLKSPTRTISNSGPLPRFIGEFPCYKAPKPANSAESPKSLKFDSISSLMGGLWLEWRPDVVSMGFESEVETHEATGDLPGVRAITDYHTLHDTGEIGRVEVKYSIASLSAEDREKLDQLADHAARKGLRFETVDRVGLEANGFIQTILLLRPYSQLQVSEAALARAIRELRHYEPANLWEWRARAAKHRVPTSHLYQLLYRQALPLVYEPLVAVELSLCRA
jgi:hypothetical protein